MKTSANETAATGVFTPARIFHHHDWSSPAIPWGSNTQVRPNLLRSRRVTSTMSRLFEVARTAPGATRIRGTSHAVVLPVLGPAIIRHTNSQDENNHAFPRTMRPIGKPGESATTPSRDACDATARSPRTATSRRAAALRATLSPRFCRRGPRCRHRVIATRHAKPVRRMRRARTATARGCWPRIIPPASFRRFDGNSIPVHQVYRARAPYRHVPPTPSMMRRSQMPRPLSLIESHMSPPLVCIGQFVFHRCEVNLEWVRRCVRRFKKELPTADGGRTTPRNRVILPRGIPR